MLLNQVAAGVSKHIFKNPAGASHVKILQEKTSSYKYSAGERICKMLTGTDNIYVARDVCK